mmetsp:Transcript_19726/g.27511  ORF Transcript_19726/g.27511 Transcript_19726/m.27511 type:complete len:448 (+) Transcript_19726:16-1359(+)
MDDTTNLEEIPKEDVPEQKEAPKKMTWKDILLSKMLRNILLISLAWCLGIGCQFIHYSTTTLASDKITRDSQTLLPMTFFFAAQTIVNIPASIVLGRFGRRNASVGAAFLAVFGAILSCIAIRVGSFGLLVFSMIPQGINNCFVFHYRFAAMSISTPEFRSHAISITIAGGIFSSFTVLQIPKWTKSLLSPDFTGTYMIIIFIYLILAYVVYLINFTPYKSAEKSLTAQVDSDSTLQVEDAPKPSKGLLAICNDSRFWISTLTTSFCYGIMSLLMAITPLDMDQHDFSFWMSTTVMQVHVFAMFFPSLIAGPLISFVGKLRLILIGLFLMFLSCYILCAGPYKAIYFVGMTFLGIGWNFTFIGGTAYLNVLTSPENELTVQAAHDTFLFFIITVLIASAGYIDDKLGYVPVAAIAGSFLVVWLGIVLWWAKPQIVDNELRLLREEHE